MSLADDGEMIGVVRTCTKRGGGMVGERRGRPIFTKSQADR